MGKYGNACKLRFVGATVLIVFYINSSSSASPRSSDPIDAGIAHLQAGRADAALQVFMEVMRTDPNDSEAAFFTGVALNRLGRVDEALAQLSSAQRLGSNHPDLPFEMGWSLLELRRWQEAIEQLNRYEAQNPGRGQTSEFLGRAHLALGHYKEAEDAFAQALQRDPGLLPTVSVYRALLRQRQGDELAARDELSGLLRAAPGSTLGQLVGGQLQPLPGQPSYRGWNFALRSAVGYNSDARGSQLFEPPHRGEQPPAHGSSYALLGLDTDFAIMRTSRDRLTVGYSLLGDFYARQETDPDLLDQYAYLEYWRALGERLTTTLRISENYTFVGEAEFRNELAGQASLAWKLLPTFVVEGSYRYAYDDYLFDTPSVLNRDAQAHTLTLAAELALPKQNTTLRGGYFHTWNLARGDDFDYHSDGLFAGLTCALPWKITGEAFYVHTFDRYDDPNSAASPAKIRRDDDVDGVTVRFSRPLGPHLTVYVEYNFNRDDSNIRGYDYEQHLTSGGLVWRF